MLFHPLDSWHISLQHLYVKTGGVNAKANAKHFVVFLVLFWSIDNSWFPKSIMITLTVIFLKINYPKFAENSSICVISIRQNSQQTNQCQTDHQYFDQEKAFDPSQSQRHCRSWRNHPDRCRREKKVSLGIWDKKKGKTRQDKAIQYKAMQDKTIKGMTRQCNARQDNVRQDKTRKGMTRQANTKQGNARCKTRKEKACQGNTKQDKIRLKILPNNTPRIR